MCVITKKRKFENVKNCLEATQLENKINYLEKKIKLAQIVLKEIIKKLIKSNKSILNYTSKI